MKKEGGGAMQKKCLLISRFIEVLNCMCVSSHWRAEESKKHVCFDQATRYCIKSRTIKPSDQYISITSPVICEKSV